MIRRAIAPALFVLCGQGAQATLVYGGGGTYVVETAVNENVVVQDGTTVTIDSNGSITGMNDGSGGHGRAAIQTRHGIGNVVNIVGSGRVVAGAGQAAIFSLPTGRTTVHIRDDATVVGNIDSDTSQSGWENEETANKRLYIGDRATINGSVSYTGYIRLDGQAAILGNLGTSNGESSINIHGGVVTGRLTPGGLISHHINMDGGAILGGIDAYPSLLTMQMTGGFIGGTGIDMRDGQLDAEIHDGQIRGGIRLNASYPWRSEISIFGGQLDASPNDWLIDLSFNPFIGSHSPSLLAIWGGHLGYDDAGLGIRLDYFTDLDIYGRDLLFTDGFLSGFLSDGSWFRSALTFGENWQGAFRIHNVPEPGTLGLLMFGLAVAAFGRRRQVA